MKAWKVVRDGGSSDYCSAIIDRGVFFTKYNPREWTYPPVKGCPLAVFKTRKDARTFHRHNRRVVCGLKIKRCEIVPFDGQYKLVDPWLLNRNFTILDNDYITCPKGTIFASAVKILE